MDGIQTFKKGNFCVKNFANRPAILCNFCLEFDFFNSLSYSPRINRGTLNLQSIYNLTEEKGETGLWAY